jgi:cytochrome c peroxidase
MRRATCALLWLATALHPSVSLAENDPLLRKVILAFDVKAHTPTAKPFGAKEKLGQALFFDPFVSGPKSIACAACHVRSLGAGDGLPVAVGLGAEGVGEERMRTKSAFVIPRNAFPFFNRGSDDFVAFFWDGRVQRGADGRFESPLGKRLPGGFESLLAVACVFPPAEPDEMLGRSATAAGASVYHGELVGPGINADNLQERTLSAFQNLVVRLLAPKEPKPDAVVVRYRELFRDAYPNVALSQFGIQHVGNALAAYIGVAFELKPSAWDRYVDGDASALSSAQKKGALLFFGKGRCAVCHAGTQFSDFRFHGLAIPQQRVGKHARYVDYGRASATSRGEDRFAFRTPPLRNVVSTGPWGHNGSFASIEAIIQHHANPVPALYAAQQQSAAAGDYASRQLGFRSAILAEMPPLSSEDIGLLKEFLTALSSPTVMSDDVALPADVPSGKRQFIRH